MMYSGKWRKSMKYLPLLMGLIVGGAPMTVLAQLEGATVGRSGNFGGITNIGQLRTSVTGSLARFSSGTPSGGTSSNAVGARAPRTSDFGGRRSPSVRGFGTTFLTPSSSGSLIMFFGRSPSARVFGAPGYDGRGSGGFVPTPGFSTPSTRQIINNQRSLPILKSFHHRALLPTVGGAVRDELTNMTLRNARPIPQDISYDSDIGISQSEFFAKKMEARYQRYLRSGWDQLKVDQVRPAHFIAGRTAFKNASLIHPDELEPRIGKLICALGAAEFATAAAELQAIIQSDLDLTQMPLSTQNIFSDAEASKRILSKLNAIAYRSSDTVEYLMLHAYMLWIDGQRTAALSAARKINTGFRTSAYAELADRLIKVMEEPKAKPDSSAES